MDRILVIEDDPDVRDTVCMTLESIFPAAEVLPAYDKTTFHKAFDGPGGFSLIVADLMLPDISGMEICEIVRRSPGGKKVPILAMTGYDTTEMKSKVLAAGANEYLSKPFEMDDFVGVVRGLMAASKRAGSL